MRKIETLRQVQALIGDTYMYAAIIAILALVLAYVVANLIKFQGGKNPTDHITRRVWFVIIGILSTIGFFLYNALYVSTFITKAPLQAKFSSANLMATLMILGIYFVLGIIIMLIMRNSKWGSILGLSKKIN